MISRSAGELINTDRVIGVERSEASQHRTIETGTIYRHGQIDRINSQDSLAQWNRSRRETAQRDDVEIALLREVTTLRSDIRNGQNVVHRQPLLNRETYVCNSGDLI